MLSCLDVAGRGLEIGPSHNPVAPKRAGFRVDIVDHCDREGLLRKYEPHGIDLNLIEEVDFVSTGGSYAELTGHAKYYDWVIASHVIEHLPDLVGFLNSCDEVLKDGGVLSLAIPDKRYCFDRFRALTGIAQLVDAHLGSHRNHTPGRVVDYFLNVVKLGGNIAWDAAEAARRSLHEVEFVHGLADAKSGMKAVIEQDAYLDIHAWCFTPSSFRLMMGDLHELGLTPLRELRFHGTVGNEFYMALSRNGDGHGQERKSLVREIEIEVAQCVR
jgi:SAM-dependent methyltransferase